MAYEIPKNLTKYSEQFIWGLTFKQFAYIAVTLAINAYVILKLQWSMYLKGALLVPFDILILLILVAKLENVVEDKRNLKKSLHNVAYYDKGIDTFIDVKYVENKCALRKDGTIMAVLKVQPLNFSLLADDQKEYTLHAYRQWLRGLDYPVQIISRSTPLDIESWLDELPNTTNAKEFASWITKEMETYAVRNRQFYIVIQLQERIAQASAFKQLADLFLGKKPQNWDKGSYDTAIRKIADRVKHCSETLNACGVNSERLNTDGLLQLYASYFTDRADIHPSVLSPLMSLSKKRQAELAKVMQHA